MLQETAIGRAAISARAHATMPLAAGYFKWIGLTCDWSPEQGRLVHVTSLVLSSQISNSAATSLGDSLRSMLALRSLTLQQAVQEGQLARLFDDSAGNEKAYAVTHLTSLHIMHAKLADRDTQALAAALQMRPGLKDLALDNCNLAAGQLASMAPSIACLTGLKTLHMSDNPLGSGAVAAAATALCSSSRLCSLRLQSNQLTGRDVAALAQLFSRLPMLSELLLGGNTLGAKGIEFMAPQVTSLSSLRLLGLQGESESEYALARCTRHMSALRIVGYGVCLVRCISALFPCLHVTASLPQTYLDARCFKTQRSRTSCFMHGALLQSQGMSFQPFSWCNSDTLISFLQETANMRAALVGDDTSCNASGAPPAPQGNVRFAKLTAQLSWTSWLLACLLCITHGASFDGMQSVSSTMIKSRRNPKAMCTLQGKKVMTFDADPHGCWMPHCKEHALHGITELELRHGWAPQQSAKELHSALNGLSALRKLVIVRLPAANRADGVDIVTAAAQHVLQNLADLQLVELTLQDTQVDIVTWWLPQLPLRKLQLHRCDVMPAKAFLDCCTQVTTLRHLDLTGGSMVASSVSDVARLLSALRLHSLRLEGQNITNPAMEYLAPALSAMTSLERLSLRTNNLSRQVAPLLEIAFQGLKQLQELDVSVNVLKNEGVMQLSGVVPHLPKLTMLAIERTAISSRTVKHFIGLMLGRPGAQICVSESDLGKSGKSKILALAAPEAAMVKFSS